MIDSKYILIALILVILALVIGIGAALFSQSEVTYETLNISSTAAIDVPKTDDASWIVNENGIKTYQCPSKKVFMNTYNSAEDYSSSSDEEFANYLDMWVNSANEVENYTGYEIKESTINDTHYYIAYIGNETTHDNIIIGSEDLEILKHMLDSLVFAAPAVVEDNEHSDTEDTYVEDTVDDDSGYYDDYSSSSSQSSYSSSSDSSSSDSSQSSDSSSSSSQSSSDTHKTADSSSSSSKSSSSSSSSGSSKTPSNSGSASSEGETQHVDFK